MPYTCRGEQRGECGVKHSTQEEAAEHVVSDHETNGWTDRYIVDLADNTTYGITKAGDMVPITLEQKT